MGSAKNAWMRHALFAGLRLLDAGHNKRLLWHGKELHPEQTVDAATESEKARECWVVVRYKKELHETLTPHATDRVPAPSRQATHGEDVLEVGIGSGAAGVDLLSGRRM